MTRAAPARCCSCAVYQNYAGQRYPALKTTQQALTLAERNGLAKEIIWAMWGADAISIQQGNFEEAESKLVDLQAELSKQNDWVLSDFVDVVKQDLLHPMLISTRKHYGAPLDRSFGDLLTLTFDWLQHWGFSCPTFGS